MRFLPVLLAISALGTQAIWAGDTSKPRPACAVHNTPAALFDAGQEKPTQDFEIVAETIVRRAHFCRLSTVTMTVFGSGELAARRAESLTLVLAKFDWPRSHLVIDYKPIVDAPGGEDRTGHWTAGAVFGFRDPDPAWQAPLEQPPQNCTGDWQHRVCKPAPWPATYVYARTGPILGADAPLVIFKLGQSELDSETRAIVDSEVQMMKDANYQRVLLVGLADVSEPDAMNLSRQRAESVRAEMIRLGIPPRSIQVEARGAVDPLSPPNTKGFDPRLNARVAVDIGD